MSFNKVKVNTNPRDWYSQPTHKNAPKKRLIVSISELILYSLMKVSSAISEILDSANAIGDSLFRDILPFPLFIAFSPLWGNPKLHWAGWYI